MNEYFAQQDARQRITVINGTLAGFMAFLHGAAALAFNYGQRDVVGAGLQVLGTLIWAAYAAWEVR
jgi:hypothetical protein